MICQRLRCTSGVMTQSTLFTDRAAYLSASRQSNHLEVGLELMLVLTAAELSAGSAAPLHSNYKSILVRIILEISACGRAVRVIFILKHFRISKRKMEKREIAILLTGLFFYVTWFIGRTDFKLCSWAKGMEWGSVLAKDFWPALSPPPSSTSNELYLYTNEHDLRNLITF